MIFAKSSAIFSYKYYIDEGIRYDMSQFLVPDNFTGFGYKSMGATNRRFVKAIYDGLVEEGYFTDVDTDHSSGWDSNGNFTKGPYNSSISSGDYRFNPWFTGKWINY